MSRGDDGDSNCKGFWFFKKSSSKSTHSSAESLSILDPPKLQCDQDLPAYGMYLLPDPTCVNATGDAAIGCIGKDNVPCSRCVYDLPFCKTIFEAGSPGMCDDFVRAAKERHAPSCIPKPKSEETYIRFKTEWEPILKSEHPDECEDPQTLHQLLGESLGSDASPGDSPESLFNPLYIQIAKTIFHTGKPYDTVDTDLLAAWTKCSDDRPKCAGFTYGAPNDDPPQIEKVQFKFYSDEPDIVQPSKDFTSYKADWTQKPPSPAPPTAAKVVVV